MTLSLYLLMLNLQGPLEYTHGTPDTALAPPPVVLFRQEVPPVPEKPADPWLGMDKLWHWTLSFSLTGSAYHFTADRLQHSPDTAAAESLAFVLLCGILKELYDLYSYGLFSYKDIVFDLAGITCGYFVFIY